MAGLNFENIRLVLGESNRQVRQGVRTALHHEGFRNILDTDRFQLVRDAVIHDQADLLICDTALDDGAINELTFKVRHHEIGQNPFLVVMTLTGSPDPRTVRAVINSGSDDLVLKPLSPGTLLKRIEGLVKARKGFVVTTDYIGPDRRRKDRPSVVEVEVIDVPNMLQAKALDRDLGTVQAAIDRVASVVNEQKMERHAFQIAFLVERIVPHYVMGMADESVIPQLARLEFVAEDIHRRMKGTNFEHVGDLCLSMTSLVTNIRKTPLMPSPKDVMLLPKLATAIRKAFAIEEATVKAARDISEQVQRKAKA